jgi:hypothetical protein
MGLTARNILLMKPKNIVTPIPLLMPQQNTVPTIFQEMIFPSFLMLMNYQLRNLPEFSHYFPLMEIIYFVLTEKP